MTLWPLARYAPDSCSSDSSLFDPGHHQGGIGAPFVVDFGGRAYDGAVFTALRYDFSDPKRLDNDRFVLSKGHAAPVLYAAWAAAGLISEADLLSLRRLDSIYERPSDAADSVDRCRDRIAWPRSAQCDRNGGILKNVVGSPARVWGAVWRRRNGGRIELGSSAYRGGTRSFQLDGDR